MIWKEHLFFLKSTLPNPRKKIEDYPCLNIPVHSILIPFIHYIPCLNYAPIITGEKSFKIVFDNVQFLAFLFAGGWGRGGTKFCIGCICPGRKFISESDNILHIYIRGAIIKFYSSPCSRIFILDSSFRFLTSSVQSHNHQKALVGINMSIFQHTTRFFCLLYSQIRPLHLVIQEFLQ